MKDIPGFEGLYAITEDGRVWSYPRRLKSRDGLYSRNWKGRFLKPSPSSQGYLLVTLAHDARVNGYIHKLVAMAFIPNPNDLPQVNHKNGIKTDNRMENLEWVTCQENINHAFRTGLKPIGAQHWMAKLDDKTVLEIRRLYSNGVGVMELARAYELGHSTIGHIVHRETWRHLPNEQTTISNPMSLSS
jgi:hypothetical protein